ncbi:Flagellar biosynthetic protein FliP precursor [Anaerohalosphaera lusitana]|uniref:Flagellar biosynthetic protein FliP n=1 Tax=Anaerohalosphaera lusitana TaxID=1936003 RepID=A0A1U9NGP3_9BACT|nr:flagellar type III secretion system pore protein FliP [Anaerohalosphaera lusitana]AQT66904.1 Flagellar biosynthetic protein FliP precursor [Anaerohalosphaera lusitana]
MAGKMRFLLVGMLLAAVLVPFAGAAEGDEAGQSNVTNGTMPSVPQVLDVIDKATAAENLEEDQAWSGPIKMVIVFAVLAILPSLLIMMTSFTRIIIVLSFVRRALSTQNIPPTIAIIGLALFLTLFTMAPTFSQVNEKAIQPYLNEDMEFADAMTLTGESMKDFMIRQTRKNDLKLFVQMSGIEPPESPEDVAMHVAIPAFIISEFRTAFEIGCLLFIPFLLIDLVTASILLSAGMMMLPPAMISLPFKLILFILVDGWGLLAKSLSLSFQ